MPHIIQLDRHVADLIAAGEVVERPASAVKELVENAIDAGATQITVELQNGGMTYLRVTDNGCGISPEDAPTAFLRHATSKLRTKDDLAAIGTLGFRGEALAAISAVSRIDLLTHAEGCVGISLHLEGGVLTTSQPAGCPTGTTIIVRDLFFNTPARMKFMKSDSAESSAIAAVVQQQALAHPEISFRLLRDGAPQLQTAGDGDRLAAIYTVFGRELAGNMLRVDGSWEKLRVTGYTTKPTATRGNRALQYFFLNGRFIRSRLLSAALEEAYRNQLMSGRFPACVLELHMPLPMVDVNVHPAKTEVKFLNERDVFDAVRYAVLSTLSNASGRAAMHLGRLAATQAASQAQATPTPGQSTPARTTPSNPVPAPTSRPAAADRASAAAKPDFYKTMQAAEYRRQVEAERTPGCAVLASTVQYPTRTAKPASGQQGPLNAPGQPSASTAQPPLITPSQAQPRDAEILSATGRQHKLTPGQTAPSDVHPLSDASAAQGQEALPSEAQRVEAENPSVTGGQHKSTAPAAVVEPERVPLPERGAAVPSAAKKAASTQDEHRNSTGSDASPAAAEQLSLSLPEQTFRLIGEAFDSFLIVENGDCVLFIDKHAAHERILFEKLKSESHPIVPQQLLSPISAELTREESAIVLENAEILEKCGFEVSDFGDGDILIRQIPSDVDEKDAVVLLQELSSELLSGKSLDPGVLRDNLLHTIACKAAIKAGWHTETAEAEHLVREVLSREDIKYCPHGRPVCIELTKKQLEKQFKRI